MPRFSTLIEEHEDDELTETYVLDRVTLILTSACTNGGEVAHGFGGRANCVRYIPLSNIAKFMYLAL
jgi:hypothetical protein